MLKHVEDDSAILKELYNSLIPEGVIGIYVPTHPMLYSAMGKEIGHIHRYTRFELKEKVRSAGFPINLFTYDDFIGLFALAAVKTISYKNPVDLGSKNSLVLYDRVIYLISRIPHLLGFRFILG